MTSPSVADTHGLLPEWDSVSWRSFLDPRYPILHGGQAPFALTTPQRQIGGGWEKQLSFVDCKVWSASYSCFCELRFAAASGLPQDRTGAGSEEGDWGEVSRQGWL